jgi:hypothetical protein
MHEQLGEAVVLGGVGSGEAALHALLPPIIGEPIFGPKGILTIALLGVLAVAKV